jgi:hypothetical protein
MGVHGPGAEEQTMHKVVDYPLRLFADGLTGLCAMSDETVKYLSGLDLNLYNECVQF